MKQNIYGEFRALLNYAVKLEYISHNPLTKLGNFSDSTVIKKEMDYYTPEEFDKYISVAKEKAEINGGMEWGFYVFFMIAYYTVARKGEINALRLSDITVSNNKTYIDINKSISQKLQGDDIISPPKTSISDR